MAAAGPASRQSQLLPCAAAQLPQPQPRRGHEIRDINFYSVMGKKTSPQALTKPESFCNPVVTL